VDSWRGWDRAELSAPTGVEEEPTAGMTPVTGINKASRTSSILTFTLSRDESCFSNLDQTSVLIYILSL
jgi:hypothetical protein